MTKSKDSGRFSKTLALTPTHWIKRWSKKKSSSVLTAKKNGHYLTGTRETTSASPVVGGPPQSDHYRGAGFDAIDSPAINIKDRFGDLNHIVDTPASRDAIFHGDYDSPEGRPAPSIKNCEGCGHELPYYDTFYEWSLCPSCAWVCPHCDEPSLEPEQDYICYRCRYG
jgi:hypothetical protein